MIIGLIAFLNDIKKTRASQQKKILGVKLAVGFIILGLLVGAGAIVLFKNSNAYQNAVEFRRTDQKGSGRCAWLWFSAIRFRNFKNF